MSACWSWVKPPVSVAGSITHYTRNGTPKLEPDIGRTGRAVNWVLTMDCRTRPDEQRRWSRSSIMPSDRHSDDQYAAAQSRHHSIKMAEARDASVAGVVHQPCCQGPRTVLVWEVRFEPHSLPFPSASNGSAEGIFLSGSTPSCAPCLRHLQAFGRPCVKCEQHGADCSVPHPMWLRGYALLGARKVNGLSALRVSCEHLSIHRMDIAN